MSSSLVGDIPCMSWDGEDLEAAWKSFRQHIEFMFSGPLKSCSEVQKCSYLMIWVGEKGRNIFSTWTLTEEEGKKLETYFNNFEAYFKPRSNVIYNRYKFLTRYQGQYEPFEQFATDFQVKVKDCQYDQSDNMVRDAIVIGVKNAKLREKLINIGSDLTLAKTLDVVRTYEVSHNQAVSMSAGSRSASEVNAIQGRKHKHQNKNFNKRSETHSSSCKGGGNQESTSSSKCSRCGYVKRTNPHKCPAEGKSCKKGNGKDHFASMCKTKADKPNKPRRVHVVDENDSDSLSSSDEFFVGYIDINSVDEESAVEWTEKINISDRNIKFQLDTGAQCSIIPYNVVKDMKATTEIMEPKALLKSYSGHKITSEGKVTLSCKVFEVVEGNVRRY